MQKAIAYIRVSDQRQADDGNSLTTQQRQVIAYAASRGYRLDKVFREEGESAKTDRRPRLQDLLEFCLVKSNQVDVLIIPKIDRLARNVHDYTNLKLKLSKSGVRIESIGEHIEDNPVGRFTEAILASVAQFDNEVRAERSKGGMTEAVAQGRWVWKAPVGYRNVRHEGKGTIEPDPVSAEVLRTAFALLGRGAMPVSRVRIYLEEAGLPMKKSTFYRVIQNPVYLGQIHSFGHIHQAKPPFVPLVDEETFYRARASLFGRQAQGTSAERSDYFVLRGHLRCTCGRLLTASWSKGKSARYAYYRCIVCPRSNYPAKVVEEAFAQELSHYQPVHGVWAKLEARIKKLAEQRDEFAATRIEEIETQRTELRTLQKMIALKVASGVIPDDLAKEQIQEIDAQIQALFERQPSKVSGPSILELLNFAREVFESLTDLWSRSSSDTKKHLLAQVFPEGFVYLKSGVVRTPENGFQERLKHLFSGDESRLVDLDDEFWNTLIKCCQRLSKLEMV
ncbi:MAG: recombinase family protein [Fimbriimonas sp.]